MKIEDRIKELETINNGKSIGLIIEKYLFQRNGETVPSGEPWAESEAQRLRYIKSNEWSNDGKPTGIESDEEFYAIQRAVYKKVISVVAEKLDYKDIASRVYNYLKTLRGRVELSTHEAVDKALGLTDAQYEDYKGYTYFYGGIVIKEDDFWDIHYALLGKIGMGHKYEADFSKYDGQIVGLPYNIPFVFRLKRK